MSSTFLRLRRAVSLSSTILSRHPLTPSTVIHRHPTPFTATVPSQSRYFRSSPLSLSSSERRSFNNNNNTFDDEIEPDSILFEGCDYNHWLITMEFPIDPAPTREEKIDTYLQTLAKVVGSYEEAKKKMYACSTTTFQGFQCLVSEAESEKFKGLPGVVFVLPDSYVDPVNKEYGGDKYDNGLITPRPPPMQYGRQGGRYGDRNRDFNRNPRQMPNEQGTRGYDNQGLRYGDSRNLGPQQNPTVPHQQGNQGYDNQGSRYEDNRNFSQQYNPQVPYQQLSQAYPNQGPTSGVNRNIGQEQYPPVQRPNFGPTVGGERRDMLPANAAPQASDPLPINYPQVPNQQPGSAYGNQGPTYGVTTNFRQEQYPPVQPNDSAVGEKRDPLAMNTAPRGRDAMPPYQDSNYNQNQQGFNNPQGERVPPKQRGYAGDNRNYAPPQGDLTHGQGAEGNYRQMGGGNGHRSGGNYGQTQGGSSNTHAEEGNYGQFGQTREYQGRY